MFSKILPWFVPNNDKKEIKVVMLGLDAGGKTTILYQLKLDQIVTCIPTIGFNLETIEFKNMTFQIWDCGGGDKIRPLFPHYFPGMKALIFVLDSHDFGRIDEAQEALEIWMSHENFQAKVLLIFANKQDISGSMGVLEAINKLKLWKYKDLRWHVQPTCAINGDGLHQGLEWLSRQLL